MLSYSPILYDDTSLSILCSALRTQSYMTTLPHTILHRQRKLVEVGMTGCGEAGLRLIVVHCLVSRYGMSCQLACQMGILVTKTACLIATYYHDCCSKYTKLMLTDTCLIDCTRFKSPYLAMLNHHHASFHRRYSLSLPGACPASSSDGQ
jgi:hypothetical protein